MQRLIRPLRRHWLRVAVTLLPVLMALAHAAGAWRLPFLDRFDALIYDARLRAYVHALRTDPATAARVEDLKKELRAMERAGHA